MKHMRRVECLRVMTDGNYSLQQGHKDTGTETETGAGRRGPSLLG